MTVQFILLVLAAYLIGAAPLSYLAARWSRGIDLRQTGTRQVGTGNLQRMAHSWEVSLPIGAFDAAKGALMVWLSRATGLEMWQGVVVGLATVIGHDWSVFLGFSGGRGILTAIGLIIAIPLVYGLPPWSFLIFASVGLLTLAIQRRGTPLPVLVGLVTVPLGTWWLGQPLALTLGFLTLLLIVVAKRLGTRQPASGLSRGQLLLNRLLYDRDVSDRKAWMYRDNMQKKEAKGP